MSVLAAGGLSRAGSRDRVGPVLRTAPLVLAGVLLVVLTLRNPAVLSGTAMQAALTQAAPIAVVAMGLAVVIAAGGDDVVAGGIDLSLAATATLGSAVLATALTGFGWAFGPALALAVGVALLVGLLNAALVVGVGMTPILATLATSVLVGGVIRVTTTNRRIDVDDAAVVAVRDGRVLGLPVATLVALGVLVLLGVLVHRTAFGTRLQAVGGNRDAAITSGLRPAGYVVASFVLAALAAGVDSVLLVARGSGFSPGTEDRLLVDMVLAAYLSPVFSRRGTVTVPGAFLSAIAVAVLSNGLILSRVDNSWVYGFKGALILAVVVTSTLAGKVRR